MEDKQIKKCYKNFFENNLEMSCKILKVFDKEKCWIGASNSPELVFYPFVCQLWEGRDQTLIEEDLMCAMLWQRIIQGKVEYQIQETPRCFRDDQIKENKELVESYVNCCLDSKIVEADFWGGTQGADGFIKFSEPLIKSHSRFPLEVGYIKPTQFLYHLNYGGCIARVPYGSDYIIYFEDVEGGLVA